MSWQCKLCETLNPDDAIECEVCGGISPYLSRFDYDEINQDKPTTIRWKAESCDKVYIKYRGHVTDVTGINAIRILTKHDTQIAFKMYGKVADREYIYAVQEHKPPITNIRSISDSDLGFISELCEDKDFKHYFTLGRYGNNVEDFFKSTLLYNRKGLTFTYVIENMDDGTPVGMLNCQIKSDNDNVVGYITYAVLPIYRNYGVATEALSKMKVYAKKCGVDVLSMSISTENKSSMRVAEKCGFKCDKELLKNSLEDNKSIMLTWNYVFSEHISKRDILGKKGETSLREGRCEIAIRLLNNSLRFKCPKNSDFSDGKIYFLISLVYRELGEYQKALQNALKARDAGYVDKKNEELIEWLRENQFSL
ncbi:GNAT family N-acetyltransferase [Hallella absiana]|uniref:GNAT family N-acetyltransferase n=1 Tax=Hallella absiana TaxID=2925336 RepID=UPI0021C61EA6|nr:GNAT family N-acetyltransferase [Hallella absiana]